MKEFLKEAANRLKSDTPAFFKQVGNIGTAIAATGGAIITPDIVGAHIPDTLAKIGGYLLTGGAVAKAISHLACVTPPDQSK